MFILFFGGVYTQITVSVSYRLSGISPNFRTATFLFTARLRGGGELYTGISVSGVKQQKWRTKVNAGKQRTRSERGGRRSSLLHYD